MKYEREVLMRARSTKRGSVFVSLVVLAFLLATVAPLTMLLGGGAAYAAYPEPAETKIRELIYPTLGNPAVIKRGETLEVEWDFRDGDPAAAMPASVDGWSASLATSATQAPLKLDLTTTGIPVLGPSSRWPVFYRGPDYGLDGPEAPGAGGLGYDVYHASFAVPVDAPVDLYNLTVSVTADGEEVSRTTDNSVKVVEEFKDDYWIGIIADAHSNDSRGVHRTYAGNLEVMEHRSFRKGLDLLNHLDLEYVLVAGDTCMGVPNKDYSVYIPKAIPKTEVDVYKYEYSRAYNAMKGSRHPLVMAPGNHDSYVTDDGDDDGFHYWEDFFAPLYHGWDYGDRAHVSVVNSNDHTYDGDTGGRVTVLRSYDLIDTSIYVPTTWYIGKIRETQRNWMAAEIPSGASSPFTAVLQHHAPATEHKAWQNGFWSGLIPGFLAGWPEGEKGLAEELALLNDNQVDTCVTGHEHGEAVGYAEGNDHTVHLNNTTMSFDCTWYPGVRLVHVSGGNIDSYCYYPDPANNDKWSVPIYAEAAFPVPEPATSEYLSTFSTPLLESLIIESGVRQFPTWAGYDWTRGVTDITRRVVNHFDPASPQVPALENGCLTFNMPRPATGTDYVVEGPYKSCTWTDTEVDGLEYRVFDVVVDLPAGATTDVRVRLVPPEPYIGSISTSAAPVGAEVTLEGANFGVPGPSSKVSFGAVDAAEYTSWSDGQIVATVPAGVAGEVQVTVTTPLGTSNGVDFAPLAVSSVAPSEATQGAMSLPVDVSGSGFRPGVSVTLVRGADVISAGKVEVDSSEGMTATFGLAVAVPGTYDVVVTNADGQSASLAGGFEIKPMCGAGAGTGTIMLGLSFGLLGVAGLFRRRIRPKGSR